jgi:hypothetical protein
MPKNCCPVSGPAAGRCQTCPPASRLNRLVVAVVSSCLDEGRTRGDRGPVHVTCAPRQPAALMPGPARRAGPAPPSRACRWR